MGKLLQSEIAHSSSEENRPVFITGVPRSGTSWVGQALGNCTGVRYVYEPLNLDWVPTLRGEVSHFKYLNTMSKASPKIQRVADDAFRGLQSRRQLLRAAYRGYWRAATRSAHRVVVKDPTAPLMAAWVAKQFNAKILVVLRHPCGFASSLEKLDWQVRIDYLLRQKTLMSNHLGRYEDILRVAMKDKWLGRGAFWGAIHKVLCLQSVAKSDWYFWKYEDLCRHPLKQFSELTGKLKLPETSFDLNESRIGNTNKGQDSGSTERNSILMPGVWRQRMSRGEIDAVMGAVDEFGLDLYSH